MKNTLITVFALTVVLLSCSKEKSLEAGGNAGGGGNTGGGGSATGALLIKATTTGAQPSTQDFTYNSKNQLITYKVNSSGAGINTTTTYTITRDAAGRVTKIVQDLPSGPAGASGETSYYYQDATGEKLKYAIGLIKQAGLEMKDSVAYEYTGNNITKASHYYSMDGISFDLFYYTTFTYDAKGNVLVRKLFQDMGNGLEELQTVTTEYDNKNNPANFTEDAFLEQGMQAYCTPSNALKQTISVSVDPPVVISGSTTYEYRSDGKPSRSTASSSLGGFTTTFTYK